MAKLKLDPKIIKYLNEILKDETLFKNDSQYSCCYHLVDRKNNIEVVLTDYSIFYDGNWLYSHPLVIEVNKINSYYTTKIRKYEEECLITENIISSEKWKIPFFTTTKAYIVLYRLKKQASKRYHLRVAKDDVKKQNIVEEFSKTISV